MVPRLPRTVLEGSWCGGAALLVGRLTWRAGSNGDLAQLNAACAAKQVTDQEWRSTDARAAPSLSVMDITIHQTFLPHDDPDAALAFYRDALGFEVRSDVGTGTMRW